MRLRVRPIWLVLLLACGGPQSGTEVGNPTFACGGADSMNGEDAGGAGGGYDGCIPGALPSFRCDGVACDLVDFGEVAVGATGRVALILVNDGCDTRTFAAPEPTGPVVLLEAPSWPATLVPGQQVRVVLGFTPAAAGPADGDVRFPFAPGGERLLPWIGTGR